jgi:hypothetical protein
MANEATLVYETEVPVPFKCANATGIAKGALLKMVDDYTVEVTAGQEDIFAGIAATEKIANDGKTTISVYRGGIFKMVTIAAINTGAVVSTSATANKIQAATKTSVGCKTIGVALERATGDTDTCLVEVRPGMNPPAFS